MNVAWIGLGTMGLPMARHVLQAGHAVCGFDLDASACERHAEHGGTVAASAADAVCDAEVVVTMLPEGRHVHAALLGEGGAAYAMAPGTLLIEMSTIHPLETDAVRQAVTALGVRMVDAPVGRTSRHAHTGELLVMAGGTPADLEQAAAILDAVGSETVDCGGPGMGSRMKIVNNFLSAASNALTAEALVLAEASGLDVATVVSVVTGTAAGKGHLTTTYPGKALAGDVTPDFMLRLAHKDLRLGVDLGTSLGTDVRVASAALDAYRDAEDEGRGGDDWTALYPFTRRRAGLRTEPHDG